MTEDKPRGRFVWFDLMTSNPAATAGFYPAVTGWGTSEWNGPTPYTMWTTNGTSIGGVMPLPSRSDAPPHWLAYISTPNADATIAQAVDLGARVLRAAADIPTVGRFAVLSDPQGAVFAVFTAESTSPGHDDEPRVGEFSWHELATHDYPAAYRFYERLFGWEKGASMDMGGGSIYQMFTRKGIPLGGIFNRTPDMSGPPAWLHYVRVDDVHRAVEVVKERGGHILVEPMEVPGGDLIAQCTDPQGARFALHAKRR
jgi:predicted enzyme related to lactoylglutathione lyase